MENGPGPESLRGSARDGVGERPGASGAEAAPGVEASRPAAADATARASGAFHWARSNFMLAMTSRRDWCSTCNTLISAYAACFASSAANFTANSRISVPAAT